MTITEAQKSIVQTTFAQVTDAEGLASRFYEHLFLIDPTIRPMFPSDLSEQGKKLMQTLAVVVNGLDNIESLVPAIENLGKRHVGYGVTVDQWKTVGSALLWALADTFGVAFTEDVREAWAIAYSVIAQTAISAAYKQEESE